jgi:hypothetical protein
MIIQPQIRLKVKMRAPQEDDILPPIPVVPIANRLMANMTNHWKASLLTGRKPSGSSLPNNASGKPMGLGRGTFVRAMGSKAATARRGRKLRANKAVARMSLQGMDKRHAIAWGDLHKNKNMDFQSKAFDGAGQRYFQTLIAEEMKKLSEKLARAMRKKGKKAPVESDG